MNTKDLIAAAIPRATEYVIISDLERASVALRVSEKWLRRIERLREEAADDVARKRATIADLYERLSLLRAERATSR